VDRHNEYNENDTNTLPCTSGTSKPNWMMVNEHGVYNWVTDNVRSMDEPGTVIKPWVPGCCATGTAILASAKGVIAT
jgi:hypothetical protein